MSIGTWLDFIDRQGRIQPGKLSWISPISGRLMFVNRRGARLCVAPAEELAMMVWLDRLRLHREGDAFYSAMQEVVDGLEPSRRRAWSIPLPGLASAGVAGPGALGCSAGRQEWKCESRHCCMPVGPPTMRRRKQGPHLQLFNK